MAKRIAQLNRYLSGWVSYFALADTPSTFEELDKWLRRRLRAGRWKDWKRGHTRKRNLQQLGVEEWAARQGCHEKGPWRMAHTGALQRAMGRLVLGGPKPQQQR
jgi:RNA-directed DNA polymerase